MIEGLVVNVAYRGSRVRGWKVKVRQLFAVPAGAPSTYRGPRSAGYRRRRGGRPPTRSSRSAGIPRGLLVARMGRPTPAEVVGKYLDIIHRRRLWAVCGDLPACPEKAE